MPKLAVETIRVIEWESVDRPVTTDHNETEIHSDVYQVLTWVTRQLLFSQGYRIGFEKFSPAIRLGRGKTPKKYVQAILSEINEHEEARRNRFRSAKEFNAYELSDEEPESSIIEQFHIEMGVSGKDAGSRLANEVPKTLLGYGFERVFYPLFGDQVTLAGTLSKLGILGVKRPPQTKVRQLRKKFGSVGRYLTQNPSGKWTLDFSLSPLIGELTFCTIGIFHPLFKPKSSDDPYTMPLNRFVSKMADFLFRDDRDVNPTPLTLRKQLSAKTVRERIRGNRKRLSLLKSEAEKLGLVSTEFYAYLAEMNGRIRPEAHPFIKPWGRHLLPTQKISG